MTHPDPDEQRLREVLGAMNELQPPTDELFVQRAILRGRARVAQRRNRLVGAAAAIAIVTGGVGTWWALDGPGTSSSGSTAAGVAPEVASKAAQQGDSRTGSSAGAPASSAPASGGPGPLAASAGPGWFAGPMTPQRAAMESLAGALTTSWADTFSGAWATDATNTSVVVAVTRADAGLESFVRAAMPRPADVRFVLAEHSYRDKAALADTVRASVDAWRREGVVIESVTQDFRADRVAVVASGANAASRLTERYGSAWVRVTVLPASSVSPTR